MFAGLEDKEKDVCLNNTFDYSEEKDRVVIDPRQTCTRFYMLFLACFLCFSCYFVHDNPATLELELEKVRKT